MTLWEALFGARPFRNESLSGLAFNVIEGVREDPPPEPDVPAWIQRVLTRGLQRRPEARFASMNELLAALTDDPAVARRRRLRWLGAATAGGGLVAAAFLLLQRPTPDPCEGARAKLDGIWDDDRKTVLETAVLETAVPYAEPTWSRIETSVDRYAQEWVDAHVEVCRATMVRGEQSDGLMDARIRCLERRRGALVAFVDQLAHADARAVENATQAAEGLPALDRCNDLDYVIAGSPATDDPARQAAIEALELRLDEIEAVAAAGHFSEAAEKARALLPEAEALDEPRITARARFVLGRSLTFDGSWPEAEPVLRQAYADARAVGDEDLVANAATSLVFVIGSRLARHAEGLGWVEHAEIALGKVPNPVTQVRLLNAAGGIDLAREDPQAALERYERALALAEHTMPGSYNHALSLNNVGLAYESLGQLDRALLHFERSGEVFERALGPGHPRTAMPRANTASIHFRRGEYEQAIALGQQVVAIREAVLPPNHPSMAHALNNLGNSLHFAGRSEEALAVMERAHRSMVERLGPDHPDVATCLSNLGMVHRALGHDAQALAANRRALEIRVASLGEDHPSVAASHNNLASALHQSGDTPMALAEYERALAIYERANGAEHFSLAPPLTGIGLMLLELQRPAEAIVPLERALTLHHDDAPAHERADTEYALARALLGSGRDPLRARALGEAARDRYLLATSAEASRHREAIEQWLGTLPAAERGAGH